MNRTFLALGIVLVVLGVAVYSVSTFTSLIGSRTHHTIPLGGIGLAVLGGLFAAGGVMMGAKPVSQSELKCSMCGAIFSSQGALDQHTKAKHAKS